MARKPMKQKSEENEPLTEKELAEFATRLETKRDALLGGSLKQNISPDHNDKLPDEVDLATAEYEAAFENRLRDRDQFLLKKIEKALVRIAEGEYDECDGCGGIIAKKRLEARPEATLCIVCKEEQEQIEKGFLKKRQIREEEFSF
jgi:DnaK suppressor protein